MDFNLQLFSREDLDNLISKRTGEIKLGSTLTTKINDAKFVILGVEESIGPKANFGKSGSENGFDAFLSAFLNMQSNESLSGEKITVLGKIISTSDFEGDNLREGVEKLDEFILSILNEYIKEGQIPILIGGGHNNAYPLIKFSAQRFNNKINVINLDAHADYRPIEGRHSGNSFSYGFKDGFINKYYVLGLHQRYNSQQILDDLRRDKHFFTFHEDYLFGSRNYLDEFRSLRLKLSDNNNFLGIELDLDTIERMPSSALSPVGISIFTARQYLYCLGKSKNVAYLHLPEGAPQNKHEDIIVGKTLAYLVSDFVISYGI